jgi:hypothetical protein
VTDRHRPPGRVAVALLAAAALAVLASGCAGSDASPAPSASAAADGPVVVTFEVAETERYRILLTEPDDIDTARRLLAGEDVPSIPNGLVVRGETGVNEGYGWSIDPGDVEFADMTMEVCDGLPSDVEAGVVTSDRYCPWSAVVVDVQPAP